MTRHTGFARYWVAGFGLCLALGFSAGLSSAQATWVDEIDSSLNFYKTNYPGAHWDAYSQRLDTVRAALGRGDNKTVKKEMGAWFRMLRTRDQGIHDVAADELFNFALMVTPIQEYGINVPPATGAGSEAGY
ncbi:MAG: hypothetical protein NBKEAIPA_00601 [Nitrospirae bacterium]|nr:MAG: hypothetical protein UZ03_NOB001001295 [Nitrospira sp. OLB3]MBV6468729.1 hypothetical protein [Nitrospirota bacterium]MCE7964062.1 hypothetical protein [Nitrospira sp. NTP2]MCK6492747.1 DNA-binding protein [Nitrospira sp.]MEB2337088.1 DNA-binding protein [Nitrospirales bacterium]